MEVKLAGGATEHPRSAALCFAMCTPKRVNMNVHVFLGNPEKVRTIFQRNIHRKLKDQARRAVPHSFAITLFSNRPLAHGVCSLEQLTPSAFGRPHHGATTLDELRLLRLRETRASSSDHAAIVANRRSPAQLLDAYGMILSERRGVVEAAPREAR
jgi:hypothetical protein